MTSMSSRLVRLRTKVQGHLQTLFIDSRALHNFLSLATSRRYRLDIQQSFAFKVRSASGSFFKTCRQVYIELYLGTKVCDRTTFEILGYEVEGILVMTFLKQLNPEIDWPNGIININRYTIPFSLT